MTKRLSKEQKRQQAVVDLINQMFVIAGHEVTYDDIKDRKDEWYTQWTMTVEQSEEWKKWGVDYLRTNLKMSKKVSVNEVNWVNLMWGLKYSDYKLDEQ